MTTNAPDSRSAIVPHGLRHLARARVNAAVLAALAVAFALLACALSFCVAKLPGRMARFYVTTRASATWDVGRGTWDGRREPLTADTPR